jgi:hypothetical protein
VTDDSRVTAATETVIIFAKKDDFGLLDETGRGTALPIAELRKNLESFTKALQSLLPAVESAGGGFGLKELEVAVGVDGKERVGFLGTGVDVGAQATITLKFNR